MKYKLETTKALGGKHSLRAGIKRFAPLIVPERGPLAVAVAAMLVSSGAPLVGPVIIGRAIDTYVRLKDSRGCCSPRFCCWPFTSTVSLKTKA